MATDNGGSVTEYEKALDCLSSLIIRRTRADGTNKGDNFDIMSEYLKMLDLEERITQLNVIHVAGTKGKGSTCTFTESILRACGLRTGLFISPHLIDVRERFVLDGVEVSQEKFLKHFWWCWHRLQEKTSDDVPLPNYFRFLALLAFKIFSEEQVDVAILEVGLGGKFDATNVVKAPVVCGISSLGYDHMEILGNTLGEIAGEKAGIFKKGVPAYTVPQPEEAMSVLEEKASQLGIPLQVVSPLNPSLLRGQHLGLDGEHQYVNAGLAIALSTAWLQNTGNIGSMSFDHDSLADQFVFGLSNASLQGRAQIVPDSLGAQGYNFRENQLVFYLDGAHSPESLEVCAKWFSRVMKEDSSKGQNDSDYHIRQVLLFNCMSVRDPQMLLPPLLNSCAKNGVNFHKALFVPNQSVFNKVFSGTQTLSEIEQIDLSWQLALQKVWENLIDNQKVASDYDGSLVLPSIPSAIKWLRESIQQNNLIRYQVLVTGSLHLVGDVLRIIKK